MEIIHGTTELQYINSRLLEYSSHTKVGLDSKLVAKYPVRPKVDVHRTNLSQLRNLISPDSDVPCNSRDCPITGIPHNMGRYFHNGERPKPPAASSFEAAISGSTENISNSFNRTVPPPAIITAYLRICTNIHDQTDVAMVRQYQKHHMWSPIVSECPTPCSRDEFPEKHGLHGQKRSNVTFPYARDNGATESLNPIRPQIKDFTAKVTQPSSFTLRNNEESLPFSQPLGSESHNFSQSALSQASVRHTLDSQEANEHRLPTVPRGQKLITDRLQIQERMLKQMAAHQRREEALPEKSREGRTKRNKKPEYQYSDDDIYLETLLGLTDALPQAFRDRGFRWVLLNDKHYNSGFSEPEHVVLDDTEMILHQILADTISNFPRPYQPTGLPLSSSTLHNELVSLICRRQHLLASNPGKSIVDVVGDVSRRGKCLPAYESDWFRWNAGRSFQLRNQD